MTAHLLRTCVALVLLVAGCGMGREASAQDGTVRVLFVGNSLTYVNDLPGLVAGLAAATERRFAYGTVAFPDVSLEDHWAQGTAREALERQRWDVVVLQQGPSALPASREVLVAYARRFAGAARAAGARPALYMVWPSSARMADFDGVSASYRAAADAVDGLLLPVGEAWRLAWRRDPNLALYGPDGFHPSPAGSYLAALVLYEQFFGASPVGLPARFECPGAGIFALPPGQAALLQEAAAEANALFERQ